MSDTHRTYLLTIIGILGVLTGAVMKYLKLDGGGLIMILGLIVIGVTVYALLYGDSEDNPEHVDSNHDDPTWDPVKDKAWTDMLNRRTAVENILGEYVAGKRFQLTPDQAQDLRLRLGDPLYQPKKGLWNDVPQ